MGPYRTYKRTNMQLAIIFTIWNAHSECIILVHSTLCRWFGSCNIIGSRWPQAIRGGHGTANNWTFLYILFQQIYYHHFWDPCAIIYGRSIVSKTESREISIGLHFIWHLCVRRMLFLVVVIFAFCHLFAGLLVAGCCVHIFGSSRSSTDIMYYRKMRGRYS